MDRGVAALASALAWSSASAQGELADVVVSVSRSEQRSFDAPASIQSVDQEQIRTGGPQINASESLMRIPGIAAQSRQNYAQDLQVSIRGFGAR
jgi:iron complex outermembrane receptor protein